MHSTDDIHWLSQVIRRLYAARTVVDLVGPALAAVDTRFRLVAATCEEVSEGVSSYRAHGALCHVPVPADYMAYCHDNPLYPLRNSGLPILHLSRQVPRSVWLRTDHFNGVARPVGYNDQLLIVGQARPSMLFVGLYRDKPLKESEAALATLLQPHIAAAWKRVKGIAMPDGAIERLHLTLDSALRPAVLSPAVRLVLRSYFSRWPESASLPIEVQEWLRDSIQRLHSLPPPHPLDAFAVDGPRGRLLLRCFPEPSDGTITVFLVETWHRPGFTPQSGSLTEREREILIWIAEGKRDAEIAIILGIAGATVSKHVEHILRKLRVASRVAAVTAALRD